MPEPELDVLVIGGGPGGSCAATLLARAGRKVAVIEKAHFPRFHIGESLLPYNHEIFEEMGVLEKLQAANLVQKNGVQFHLGNGTKGTGFQFRNGRFTRFSQAFQVERSHFDNLLLRHAEESGATIHEGVMVDRVAVDGSGVSVMCQSKNGAQAYRAQYIVDASGRGNVTGNQEKIREVHPRLKKISLFAHFENVLLNSDESAGDTVIIRLENKWFWLIPLRSRSGTEPNRVSVGLVMDRDEFKSEDQAAELVLSRIINSSPELSRRMSAARRSTPVQTTGDFSYRNRTFWSSRVIRVGDAAGFIDPIFSSGVFLAMYSGRLAVQALLEVLDKGGDGSNRFPAYESRVRAAMDIYLELVEHFYTKPFMELFLEPRAKWQIDAAINAILAGELDGGWRLWWRRKIFFWLVKLQRTIPLVPRFSFADVPTKRLN